MEYFSRYCTENYFLLTKIVSFWNNIHQIKIFIFLIPFFEKLFFQAIGSTLVFSRKLMLTRVSVTQRFCGRFLSLLSIPLATFALVGACQWRVSGRREDEEVSPLKTKLLPTVMSSKTDFH